MPSERRGTVTDDIAGFIRRLKGTSEWKGDKAGTIRTAIAKVIMTVRVVSQLAEISLSQLDFPVDDVIKNVKYFMNIVKRATGNIRDPKAEKEKGGGPRPGRFSQLATMVTTVLTHTVQSFPSRRLY